MSWLEFRAFVNNLPNDSAYLRKRYPSQWFWTPGLQIAAASATALSDLRYLTAAQLNWEGEMPTQYLPVEYGPSDAPASEKEPAADNGADRQRAMADLLRAEMGRAA